MSGHQDVWYTCRRGIQPRTLCRGSLFFSNGILHPQRLGVQVPDLAQPFPLRYPHGGRRIDVHPRHHDLAEVERHSRHAQPLAGSWLRGVQLCLCRRQCYCTLGLRVPLQQVLAVHKAPARRTLPCVLTPNPITVCEHRDVVGLVLPEVFRDDARATQKVSADPLDPLHVSNSGCAHLATALFRRKMHVPSILREEIHTSHKPAEHCGGSGPKQLISGLGDLGLIHCIDESLGLDVLRPPE